MPSLSDGSFCGIELKHTQNNIIEKENKRLFTKESGKQKDIKQGYSKYNQTRGTPFIAFFSLQTS